MPGHKLVSMLKKVFYGLLIASLVLFTVYCLQPVKTGKGLDTTIRYEQVLNWPGLPDSFHLGNPTGISIDTSQQLVVFHRAGREWPLLGAMPAAPIGEHTILFLNKETGQLISSWGAGRFIMPHGLKVDQQNAIWVTDVGLHQVFKFSHEGQLLLALGEARVAGTDQTHFDQPTDIAIAADGSFYVSDGYGNNRIIKFSATGKYLFEWGKKGDKPGEFNLPHGLALDASGNVYVADRENHRVQVFSPTGSFLKQFTDESFGAVCAVAFDQAQLRMLAADDFRFFKALHRGSDILAFDPSGGIQSRFGRSGSTDGKTAWYHALAVDGDGSVYAGDIYGNTIQKFRKIREQ